MAETSMEVTGLITLQFAWGGLIGAVPADGLIHLVRSTRRGTPGPTLCDIDRFGPDAPGWSVGGGVTGLGIAREAYPGLPVGGSVGAREMAECLGVPRGCR